MRDSGFSGRAAVLRSVPGVWASVLSSGRSCPKETCALRRRRARADLRGRPLLVGMRKRSSLRETERSNLVCTCDPQVQPSRLTGVGGGAGQRAGHLRLVRLSGQRPAQPRSETRPAAAGCDMGFRAGGEPTVLAPPSSCGVTQACFVVRAPARSLGRSLGPSETLCFGPVRTQHPDQRAGSHLAPGAPRRGGQSRAELGSAGAGSLALALIQFLPRREGKSGRRGVS